eukprot:g3521.t1
MDFSRGAGSPTSVWVDCGDESTHRCPTGKPLSSPQGFLMANPPGPYTCVRSVGHRSAAMLQFHLDRLWESAEATGLGPAARAEGRRSLERRTTDAIARVMESFWEANGALGNDCPECMATVLYAGGWSAEDTDNGLEGGGGREGEEYLQGTSPLHILAHAWPLPVPSRIAGSQGVQVLVAGSGRTLPTAKHSSWLRERKPLDELKAQAGAQEVVLSDAQRSPEGASRRLLLEGLTSNFFVVEEDGAVCTAPSGVLCGAMRQLAISACSQQRIALRLEAPDMARAGRWRGAFLTGTGRVLAPVTALLVLKDGHPVDATKPFSCYISRVELPVFKPGHNLKGGTRVS